MEHVNSVLFQVMMIEPHVSYVSANAVNQKQSKHDPFSFRKYGFNFVQPNKPDFPGLDLLQPYVHEHSSSKNVHCVIVSKSEVNVHIHNCNVS